MTETGKIDQDALLRARVLLLGSGRLSLREEVGAYRVIAQASPRPYLPKLVRALISYGYDKAPEPRLALHAEAAEAARAMDTDLPKRTEALRDALSAYERSLFGLGRRAEGRAVCEELAEAGHVGRLATVLAEEGRHREAAALLGAFVAEAKEPSDWTVYQWAAGLSAAGLHAEAVEAFAVVVAKRRRLAAEDGTPLAGLVWELVHHARLLDAAGRPDEGAEVRREVLGLLARLAEEAESKSWGNHLSWWVTLFLLSGRDREPAASPAAPTPPFGTHLHEWSPDTREPYFDGIPALEEEAARLRTADRLPELFAVHGRLTHRSTLFRVNRSWQIEESLRPLFDEGVALARHPKAPPGALRQALTDRAMFLVAANRYEEALADYREAIVTHA
ncbi:hypothetical protein [Streptomyces sp. NPDC003943]